MTMQSIKIDIAGTNSSSDSQESRPKESKDSLLTRGARFISEGYELGKEIVGEVGSLIGVMDRPSRQVDAHNNVSVTDVVTNVQMLGMRCLDFKSDASQNLDLPTWDGNIAYLIGDYSRLATAGWSTTFLQNGLLASIPVNPSYCNEERNGDLVTRNNTRLSFFADLFNMWRGSITYKVEVICSAFHQGQLFLCYIPGTKEFQTLPEVTNMESVTMDIGLTKSVEFTVPWLSSMEYKNTIPANNNTLDTGESTKEYINGAFYIFIQNALTVQADTIPNQVDVNIYIKAGPDFEFKDPRVPTIDTLMFGKETLTLPGIAYQGDSGAHFEQEGEAKETPEKTIQMVSHKPNIGGKPMATGQIQGRWFLKSSGTVSTTQIVGTQLYKLDIPLEILNDAALGINHVSKVAYLAKFDVEFKIKAAPLKFQQGMLIMFYIPEGFGPDNDPSVSPNSYMNFPHAFLNLGGGTEATFVAPFSSMGNAYEKDADYSGGGTLYVSVWNQMAAAATASSTIDFSIWFRLVKPLFKVNTVPIEWQGASDCVDTDVIATDKTTGFLGLNHMNVYRLLDRPARIGGYTIASASSGELIAGPVNDSFVHLYIESCFSYHSGSHRIKLISNAGRMTPYNIWITYYTEGDQDFPEIRNVTSWGKIPRPLASKIQTNKSLAWRPQNQSTVEVECNQYIHKPVMKVQREGPIKIFNSTPGILMIDFRRVPEDIDLDIYHTRSDDFRLYYPGGVRKTVVRRVIARPDVKKDLTQDGDVESNPGPACQQRDFRIPVGSLYPVVGGDHAGLRAGKRTRHSHECIKCQEIYTHTHMITNRRKMYHVGMCQTCEGEIHEAKVEFQGEEETRGLFSSLCETLWDLVSRCNFQVSKVWEQFKGILKGSMDYLFSTLGGMIIDGLYTAMKEKISSAFSAGVSWVKDNWDAFTGFMYTFFWRMLNYVINFKLGSNATSEEDSEEDIQEDSGITHQGSSTKGFLNGLFKILNNSFLSSFLKGYFNRQGGNLGSKIDISPIISRIVALIFPDEEYDKYDRKLFNRDAELIMKEFNWRDGEGLMDPVSIATGKKFELNPDQTIPQRIRELSHAILLTKLKSLVAEIRIESDLAMRHPKYHMFKNTIACFERVYASYTKRMGNGSRNEPVGILISGKTGSGKTFLSTDVLPFLVLSPILKANAQEIKAQIYSIPTDREQKFMDGYACQEWACYDDLGAAKDGSDVMPFLNWISTAECPVNMASLQDKGMTFNSRVVCASTNYTKLESLKLKDSGPLVRRFPVAFDLAVKDEFTQNTHNPNKRYLDRSKAGAHLRQFKKLADKIDACDDIWTCTVVDVATGRKAKILDQEVGIRMRDIVANISDLYLRNSTTVDIGEVDYQGVGSRILSASSKVLAFGAAAVIGAHVASPEPADDIRTFLKEEFRRNDEGRPWDFVHAHTLLKKYQHLDPVDIPIELKDHSETRDKLLFNYRYSGPKLFLLLARETTTFSGELDPDRWLYCQGDPKSGLSWYERFGFDKEIIKQTGASIAILMGLIFILKLFSILWGRLVPTFQGTPYNSEGALRTPKIRPQLATRYQGKNDISFEGDVGVLTSCQYNSILADFIYDSQMTLKGRVFMIDNRHIILNRHMYNHFGSAGTLVAIVLKICGGNKELYVTTKDATTVIPETDLVMVTTTMEVQFVRSLRHLLPTDQDTQYLRDRVRPVFLLNDIHVPFSCTALQNIEGRNYLLVSGKKETKEGDCGLPYMFDALTGVKKIAGFHSGVITKNKDLKCCSILTKQAFEELVKNDDFVTYEGNLELNLEYEGEGLVCKEPVLNGRPVKTVLPCKSKIVKSLFYDLEVMPQDFAPAPLQPSILYERGKVYDRDLCFTVPKEIFDWAKEAYKVGISECDEYQDVILTPHEVLNRTTVNGSVLQPFDVSTSAGFWSDVSKKKKGIIAWNEVEECHYLIDTEEHPYLGKTFLEVLQDHEEQAAKGRPLMTLWKASLKDELRNEEKRRTKRTRQFQAAGFDHSYMCKKYLGPFRAWFVHNRQHLYHAIGIDKDASWPELREYLVSVGEDHCFDADGKDFGVSIGPQAAQFVEDMINEVCGPQYQNQRHSILQAVRVSHHIVGNTMKATVQGNNDGFYLTDIYNSMANTFYCMSAFAILWKEQNGSLPHPQAFNELVRLLTYGDDIVVSVHPAIPWFNRITVAEIYTDLGIKMTDAGKTGDMVPFNHISEVTFLKSHFVEYQDLILCPMPEIVVYKELSWHKKSVKSCLHDQVGILNQALGHAAHRGEDFYNKILNHINKVISEKELVGLKGLFDPLTFDQQMQRLRLLQNATFTLVKRE